jgi:hypothetical protein
MAISIIQEPNDFETVYNDIVYVVTSTNKTACKFKYIADVYVNGVKIFRDKLFPEPYYGYAVFKLGAILESYVTYTLDNDQTTFKTGAGSVISYYVKFGEEYDISGTCDETSTLYLDLLTSETKYAHNGVLQYEDYPDRDYSTYMIGDSTRKFLTDAPDEIDIAMNEKYYLSFMQDGTSSSKYLRVRTYDINGATYGNYLFSNPYYIANSTAKKFISMGVGPININSSTPTLTELNPQSGAIINNDVYSYKVDLVAHTNLVYNGDFLNSLGGWTVYEEDGCGRYFDLIGDNARYSSPDGGCGFPIQSITSSVSTLTQGTSYRVTVDVSAYSMSDYADPRWVAVSLGGNRTVMMGYGSTYSGVPGIYTQDIICGTGGAIEIEACVDTAFGSITINSINIIRTSDVLLSFNDVVTETKTFNIDRCKTIYEPYRFIWLNRLGGFDQFTFDLTSTRKAAITRKEYSRVLGTTRSTGWAYDVGDRGRTNTYVDAKDKYTVNSDWMDEANVNWIEQLYESLTVFHNPNIYNQQFWDCQFGSGGMVSLPFRTPHNFKVGDVCVLVLDSQYYNTTYNGTVSVTAVTELSVLTDLPYGGASTNESGYLYKLPDTHSLLPIIITNAEFEEKQSKKTKLFNYTIDFERAYDKNLQRG